MIELLWGLLNVVVFLYFIIICFKSVKILKDKLGLLALLVFIVGLVSIVTLHEKNSSEIFDLNKSTDEPAKPTETKNRNIHLQTITLEDNLSTATQLDISFAENGNDYELLTGEVFRSGFISGTNWKSQTIIVQKTQRKNEVNYIVNGSKEWKIIGLTLYSQHQSFRGNVALKK